MIARAIKPRMSTIERIECLVGQLEIEAEKLTDEAYSLRDKEGAAAIITALDRLRQQVKVAPQRTVQHGV